MTTSTPKSGSFWQRRSTLGKAGLVIAGLLLFAVIRGALVNMGVISPPAPRAASQASTVESKVPHAGVTQANFQRLETGMSYYQAMAILGEDGEEISSNEIAGVKTVMYKWEGPGFGANMNAMFQNGKLISKAQSGLK
jgi:hypothetical protein